MLQVPRDSYFTLECLRRMRRYVQMLLWRAFRKFPRRQLQLLVDGSTRRRHVFDLIGSAKCDHLDKAAEKLCVVGCFYTPTDTLATANLLFN
jgi:hypothetical protein